MQSTIALSNCSIGAILPISRLVLKPEARKQRFVYFLNERKEKKL